MRYEVWSWDNDGYKTMQMETDSFGDAIAMSDYVFDTQESMWVGWVTS